MFLLYFSVTPLSYHTGPLVVWTAQLKQILQHDSHLDTILMPTRPTPPSPNSPDRPRKLPKMEDSVDLNEAVTATQEIPS